MTLPAPPAELAFLTDRIGAAATLKLIELHGGTRVHVPKFPNQGVKLAREIGLAEAKALAEIWGGDYLKVPLCKYWRARVYRHGGASYPEIARKLGVTERAVWKYLSDAGMTTPPQPDLFPG